MGDTSSLDPMTTQFESGIPVAKHPETRLVFRPPIDHGLIVFGSRVSPCLPASICKRQPAGDVPLLLQGMGRARQHFSWACQRRRSPLQRVSNTIIVHGLLYNQYFSSPLKTQLLLVKQ
jgi:hypothetical protein